MVSTYKISSRLNGFSLDVTGSKTEPGTLVITFPYSGTNNQLWYDDVATGTIRTILNGFCLDSGDDGRVRIQPYKPGNANQQWQRDSEGYIRNRVNPNKVLDVDGSKQEAGAGIIAWTRGNNQTNQLWNFENVKREFYIVSSLASDKVLDIDGHQARPGYGIRLYSKVASRNSQLWYADKNGYIRSAVNDLAIDVAPGDHLIVQTFQGGNNQQWVLGGNKIINRSRNQVVDVYHSETQDGTLIIAYQNCDTPNQRWSLEYAPR